MAVITAHSNHGAPRSDLADCFEDSLSNSYQTGRPLIGRQRGVRSMLRLLVCLLVGAFLAVFIMSHRRSSRVDEPYSRARRYKMAEE